MGETADKPTSLWVLWHDALEDIGLPWGDVLECARALEVLRPCLYSGQILARHHGLFSWPEPYELRSWSGFIKKEWWLDARPDAYGDVVFTRPKGRWHNPHLSWLTDQYTPTEEVVYAVAFRIELETAGFEIAKAVIRARAIAWRADPAPTAADLSATDPPPEPAKTPTEMMSPQAKKKATAGAKESALWAEIVPHLKTLFPDNQPPPTKNKSFHAVKDWLFEKGKTLGDTTIRVGIKRHFPEWTSQP